MALQDKLNFLQNLEYYVWWLENCAANVDWWEELCIEFGRVKDKANNIFIEISDSQIIGRRETPLLVQLRILDEIESPGISDPDYYQKKEEHQRFMESLIFY